MLISTDLLLDEERREIQEATPWGERAERLAGHIRGTLANGSVDVIEVALGPGHARGALVALYEAADVSLQATMDLAESIARQRFFTRVVPLKPLGVPEPLSDPGIHRYSTRLARYSIEDAAVRLATSGDHLANAFLRFAWEANAALLSEVRKCKFDPSSAATSWWATVDDVARGLDTLRGQPLGGLLVAFSLTADFEAYAATEAVAECRRFRHRAIHGERQGYLETAAFGRSTIWAKPQIHIYVPPRPDPAAPSLDDMRAMVGKTAAATVEFVDATWAFARAWLRSLDVWITAADGRIEVTTKPLNPRRIDRAP